MKLWGATVATGAAAMHWGNDRSHEEKKKVGRDRARFATGVVLAFSIGVGAYFGSAQLAASTPNTTPRVVTLRIGDVAILGRIRCAATTDARPPSAWKRMYYMHCSKRPLGRARYVADIFPNGISVMDAVAGKQVYVTPR